MKLIIQRLLETTGALRYGATFAALCCLVAQTFAQPEPEALLIEPVFIDEIAITNAAPVFMETELDPSELDDALAAAAAEYELALSDYELLLDEYENALYSYEVALWEYELWMVTVGCEGLNGMFTEPVALTDDPFLANPQQRQPPPDPNKQAVDEARRRIDETKKRLEEQNDLKKKKADAVQQALLAVVRAASTDPRVVVKGGLLAAGATQGGNTGIIVSVESGFGPGTVVTISLDAPGNPSANVTLNADGKGQVFFPFMGRVLRSGIYTATATGTLNGKPQSGTYGGILILAR